MSDSSCIIIAITGASASGKSSIASTVHKELCNDLGCEEIGIIAEDSYYKDQSHLEMSERVKTNYDHPSSMDRDLLIQHLKDLKTELLWMFLSTVMLSIPEQAKPNTSPRKKLLF